MNPGFLPHLEKREIQNITCWEGSWLATLPAGARLHRFSAKTTNPALPLPLETASQDLFFALDFVEHLRMDQLYMVMAEARRLLKPRGLCLFQSKVNHWRTFQLTHYISPEDWRTLEETHRRGLFSSRQTLALERL